MRLASPRLSVARFARTLRARDLRGSPAMPAALALTAALALPAAAQIEPGRIYGPGEAISEPSLGLRLTIPDGWRGALSPDGETFQLESESADAYIVVIADAMSEAEARSRMADRLELGGGLVLVPAGEVRTLATSHLTGDYTVTGAPSEMAGTVDVRLTAGGLGVAFVLLSPPAVAESRRAGMRELALSLGVEEPTAQSETGTDEWEPYLRGRYLARFYTRSGYTESTELWLCSDGTFHYDSQGGGFGGGASGAVQSRGGGRWSATGAGASGTLFLDWAGGGRASLELRYDYDEDRLYVNGDRMLRGANERCS